MIKLSAVVGYHTMAREPATYIYGMRPSDGVRGPEDLSSGEVQAACLEHKEWTTRSAKIQRCLAFLATFAPSDPSGRSSPPVSPSSAPMASSRGE